MSNCQQRNKSVHARHQRGVALLTALFILALCTTAAVFLTNQHQLSIRRTGNIVTSNQAYLYALGGEALAMSVLNHDRKNSQFDALNEEWAMEAAPLPVEGGFIQGELIDLQGRFNLNNLFHQGKVEPIWVSRFEKLLMQFGLEPGLAYAVVDWMDPDQSAQGPYGAEDDYYVGLVPPYRAANTPMRSLSELRLIRGFSEFQNLELLMEHLTVLPEPTAINVNTASREVLIAVGLDPITAEEITRQTGVFVDAQIDAAMNANATMNPNMNANAGANATGANTNTGAGGNTQTTAANGQVVDPTILPFETIDQFSQTARTGQIEGFNSQGLSVSSNYFLFDGYAEVDRGRTLLKSLLRRDNNGMMQVVIRSQGDL